MNNQDRFRNLLKRAGISQERSAELIAEQTMRPLRLRTVQSWLADSSRPSSRPCPDWAIVALKAKLQSLKIIDLD